MDAEVSETTLEAELAEVEITQPRLVLVEQSDYQQHDTFESDILLETIRNIGCNTQISSAWLNYNKKVKQIQWEGDKYQDLTKYSSTPSSEETCKQTQKCRLEGELCAVHRATAYSKKVRTKYWDSSARGGYKYRLERRLICSVTGFCESCGEVFVTAAHMHKLWLSFCFNISSRLTREEPQNLFSSTLTYETTC